MHFRQFQILFIASLNLLGVPFVWEMSWWVRHTTRNIYNVSFTFDKFITTWDFTLKCSRRDSALLRNWVSRQFQWNFHLFWVTSWSLTRLESFQMANPIGLEANSVDFPSAQLTWRNFIWSTLKAVPIRSPLWVDLSVDLHFFQRIDLKVISLEMPYSISISPFPSVLLCSYKKKRKKHFRKMKI